MESAQFAPPSMTDPVTPSNIRIVELQKKLSGLQKGLEEGKQSFYEQVEGRLRALDERITRAQSGEDIRWRCMKDQVVKLQEALAAEKLARELLDEKKTKELKLLESSISLDLSVEKQARKDSEARITRQIDERCFQLRLELAREKKTREESEEKHTKEMVEEIQRLTEALESERHQREEKGEIIVRRMTDEMQALRAFLDEEKKARGEAIGALYQKIDEMGAQMSAATQTERRDREATEETLLKLLEETCNRVESGLSR
eukprot:GAFH01003726.1.p1 GENE.GAFH01003726.1~~GAFH01003726.1.p1  ORF type:complete len:268 (-),score=98.60 GAFH01003726.1:92-871(-)